MSSSDDSTDSCCDPYYVDMARLRKLDNLRQAIADGDYGVPLKCPCGERIVADICETETEKKRYLTCAHYENDGLHRRKIWVDAIEEETTRLRKTVDTHIERMRDFSSHDFQIAQMKKALQEKDNQFAKLKEEVDQLKEGDQLKDKEIAKLKEAVDDFGNRIRVLEHCCFD